MSGGPNEALLRKAGCASGEPSGAPPTATLIWVCDDSPHAVAMSELGGNILLKPCAHAKIGCSHRKTPDRQRGLDLLKCEGRDDAYCVASRASLPPRRLASCASQQRDQM